MTPQEKLDTIPAQDDIAAHLITVHKLTAVRAHVWSTWLQGLPWRYLRPLAQLAVNAGHEHPALAVASAAMWSEDEAFKAAVKTHLEGK